MEQKLFEEFRDLIYEESGIVLKEGKESLVEARVGKRLRELGLPNHHEYLDYVKRDKSGQEIVMLLDVISTNVTHFFREKEHFSFMKQILELWKERGQKKFRIWCAASSTGEEPYTLAMTALSVLGSSEFDLRILATDISTRVLEKAKMGSYEMKYLNDIPTEYRLEFIKNKGDYFEFSPHVKSVVTFARLNLSDPPFPMSGPFDFVFCRNVMIYFDNTVRNRLVTNIYHLLKAGGFLFVGHSETLTGLDVPFTNIRPSIYLKKAVS